LPLEKLLKQRFLFLIVHRRANAFSLPLSMSRKAVIAGRSATLGVAGYLGFMRRWGAAGAY
jgi:hypothetical protein